MSLCVSLFIEQVWRVTNGRTGTGMPQAWRRTSQDLTVTTVSTILILLGRRATSHLSEEFPRLNSRRVIGRLGVIQSALLPYQCYH
ncbi:uncharacterized protein BO95DRAFT_194218 [Aspergillus brunneoviolaceus CBS 621.78]|uniref:Uncharacterized protein n=1 Tax=Aspergillus brunneoviolaceus CBS 621.78 TaxID=1450534 RepID=A0ACD1GLX5_9EURO|nr:hypothetical protein BO95DRAFT_194218 [Aspergillus brunneoviolaceus CBS 621.78]RAH50200.1 hypothetical protein BO95DRAFT_194218 [Aspergillus brunneoviolaceus CBS 621.78]